MTLSRRQFVTHAAAAGAGMSIFSPSLQESPGAPSGLASGKPKPLRYAELPGFLSKEQIGWHHRSHYGGALDGFSKLDKHPTGDHRARISQANSVLLHELYFDNMTAKKASPGEAAQAVLTTRFGDLDRWVEDFRAAAKSCSGWAVLAFHPVNGKLYNVCSNSHDDGPVWSGIPLVVVDTYEHAYYLDFQNKKGDYVNAFTNHIDWTEVDRRVRACIT